MFSLRRRLKPENAYIRKCILFLFLLSFVVCAPLYIQGFFDAHDYWAHAMRLTSTMSGLQDGQFPPQVSPTENSFGMSWNLFYGPLSNYIVIFFRVLTFWIPGSSTVLAYKLFIFSTFFFSGYFMFRFVLEVSKNENIALLAACLYITAPYRIVDAFIRLAAGELLVFIFMPMVFHGFYSLFYGNKRKTFYLAVGFAGIAISHMISSLFLIIVGIVIVMINIKKVFKKEYLLPLLTNAAFALGISAFFLLPMLQAKGAADYFAFTGGMEKDVAYHASYLYQILFGKMDFNSLVWSQPPTTIKDEVPQVLGLPFVACLMALPFVYSKLQQKQQRRQVLAFTFGGIACVILATSLIPWGWLQSHFSAIGLIQHSWRFLLLAVFLLSIVSAVVIRLLVPNLEFKHIFILVLISLVYISPLITSTDNVINRTSIYGDNYMKDYMPQKAYDNMDYVENRSHDILVLSGNAELTNQSINGTKTQVTVNAVQESVLEYPYFFYPGYKITNSDGTEFEVKESANGFVSITVPAGFQGTIQSAFRGTLLTKVSLIISILSAGGLIALEFLRRRKKAKNKIQTQAVPQSVQ